MIGCDRLAWQTFFALATSWQMTVFLYLHGGEGSTISELPAWLILDLHGGWQYARRHPRPVLHGTCMDHLHGYILLAMICRKSGEWQYRYADR